MSSPASAAAPSVAVSAAVDAKAELTALLDQWESAQQGTTEELVSILTKSVVI